MYYAILVLVSIVTPLLYGLHLNLMECSQSMHRPRILFLNHSAQLSGGEKVLEQLAIAYRDQSQVVLLADGPFRTSLEANGVKVSLLAAPTQMMEVRTHSSLQALKSIPGVFQTAQQLKAFSQDFDIVHANSQKAFVTACIARLMGGKPVIWHLHDIITADHFSSFNRKIAIFLSNIAVSALVAPSQAVIDAYKSLGGRVRHCQVVHNGISSEPFDQVQAADLTQVRASLNLPQDTPLIGLFSRLSPWKGQDVLLAAARILPAHVHFLIVGSALFGEDEYAEKLQAQSAADPLLNDRVHWLGFRKDVPLIMSACNVIVHASSQPEPFGLVCLEGQLSRRPVIATAAGGMVEMLDDGHTGLLIPPGDVHALASAIQTLLDNPVQAAEMGKRGRLRAEHDFSPSQFLKSFDQFMTDVIHAVPL